MNVKVPLLIIALLLTFANPLKAENREGAFTLSPFFGGLTFATGSEKHLDTDFAMGLRGGYNFTRELGAELLLGYTETVYDPEEIRTNLYRYGADILYHFRPDKELVPFVAAGLGGFTADYSREMHDQTHLYLNYGGGGEYSLADWLALRGDFRHAVVLDGGHSNFEISLGLKFQFGGISR
jgi:OmpA-OmpF porin, OOP family